MQIKTFKEQLARVFDDNLRTRQWHNYADYVIIGFILLSTLEVFLSTYDGLAERYGTLLKAVDIITTIFFTIEVTLRIWCADISDARYRGFWGRVRYCCTFYGLIDILSTYTFYVAFFYALPVSMLKVLRIARLFRLFRYIKAFGILRRAVVSKSDEMLVSLEFLGIVTLILSFFLFFLEHAAQPDVYDNGWTSVVWAFAQYIGDPGGFAETPPITFGGRIIACIIGVLGIAIFAVPAGLIAGGFSEAMEDDRRNEQLADYRNTLLKSFTLTTSRNLDLYVKDHLPADPEAWYNGVTFRFMPKNKAASSYLIKGIELKDIVDLCKQYREFRLKNEAAAKSSEEGKDDRFVVEYFPVNRPYGFFVNRGSKVTIVSTSSKGELGIGNMAYYLAKWAGFNYISKDFEAYEGATDTFYNPSADIKAEHKTLAQIEAIPNRKERRRLMALYEKKVELRRLFFDDLKSVSQSPDSWVVCLLSQLQNQENPVDIHVAHATADGAHDAVHDADLYARLFQDLSDTMRSELQLSVEETKRYPLLRRTDKKGRVTMQNIAFLLRDEGCACNALTLRVSSHLMHFDSRSRLAFFLMAKVLKDVLSPDSRLLPEDLEDLERKGQGFGPREQQIDDLRGEIF